MASSTALCGLGVPPQLADVIGFEPSVLTTIGTAQVGAAVIKSQNVELTTAGGATAAVLPGDRPVGTLFLVTNPTATTGLVFCPVGDTMNGSANGSVSVAQNKAVMVYQYKKGKWASVLTA